MSQAGRFQTDIPAGTFVETLTGNSGGAVSPSGSGNINVVGTGPITVTGNPGTNTLTISNTGALSSSFPTDSGVAVPLAGVLNVFGAHGINTQGSGNTITAAIDNAITLGDLAPIAIGSPALTLTTGDLNITAGNISLPYTTLNASSGAILAGGVPLLHDFNVGNVFLGSGAGNTLVTLTGMFNTILGSVSAQALTSGQDNVIAGSSGLSKLTSGSNNSILGTGGLNNLVSGSNNISIGQGSSIAYTTNEDSNIIIGNPGVILDANTIRLGTNGNGVGQQNRCFIAGIDTVNVGSVATVVTEAGDQLGTAVITAGAGISVTPGANTITITATGMGGFVWTVITADQTAAVNNGYICNKGSTLLLALPATAAIGDIIEVTGINNATGWQITQAAGQQIFFGTSSTTLGATGTLTSSATRDSIRMVCVATDTTWNIISSIGNISIV